MTRARPGKHSGVRNWARGVGKLTAETEAAIVQAKADFEVKVRRLRRRQQKILKKLAAQHLSNHRALTELRVGIRRARVALGSTYRIAIRQCQLRATQKSKRARTRRK